MTLVVKRALQTAMEALSEMSVLAHISTNDKMILGLQKYASIAVLGAELQQMVNDATPPLSLFSRKLQLP